MPGIIKRIFSFTFLLKAITISALIALIASYLAPYIHPDTLFFLPFFGLVFPVTLAINALLLITWAVKRSKWTYTILIALLLGYPQITKMFAIGNRTSENQTVNSLKIVSNNVRIFDLYNEDESLKTNTRDNVLNYLKTQDADVICLQEFYQQDAPTSFETTSLFKQQLSAVDYHERFAYVPRGRQHFGIITFSKHPIISRGDVIYQNDGEQNYNYCIYTDIVKELDTFRIYNIHLQSIKLGQYNPVETDEKSMIQRWLDKLMVAYPKRADQAERIVAHIETSPYPVIVCGDFNDTPISYSYQRFNNILEDAFIESGHGIGSTYVGKIPAGRIDYIFHSSSLISYDFHIQEKAFSDHRSISCLIQKNK